MVRLTALLIHQRENQSTLTIFGPNDRQVGRKGLNTKTDTQNLATHFCMLSGASLAGMPSSSVRCSLGLCSESHMWAACRENV